MKAIVAGTFALALSINIFQPRPAVAWGDDARRVTLYDPPYVRGDTFVGLAAEKRQSENLSMTKPELGTKRSCAHCDAKFYDLHHSPITCPKCGTAFEAVQVRSRWRAEAARAPEREVAPTAAETEDAQFVSLEETDAKPGEAFEVEDEVALDDDSLDDAAFIEEREQGDTDAPRSSAKTEPENRN